jgi:hypothetical protein
MWDLVSFLWISWAPLTGSCCVTSFCQWLRLISQCDHFISTVLTVRDHWLQLTEFLFTQPLLQVSFSHETPIPGLVPSLATVSLLRASPDSFCFWGALVTMKHMYHTQAPVHVVSSAFLASCCLTELHLSPATGFTGVLQCATTLGLGYF